jgi:hypothetical protein
MVLRPQDVIVALKLAVRPAGTWTYAGLGQSLALSAAEVHNAVARGVQARLLVRVGRETPAPSRGAILEFLVHGVRYAFPATRGGLSRGFPTGHAAPGLAGLFATTGEAPPVWPDPGGPARGYSLSPLHSSAVKAARADDELYRLLAAVDLVRDGGARERGIGEKVLAKALEGRNRV